MILVGATLPFSVLAESKIRIVPRLGAIPVFATNRRSCTGSKARYCGALSVVAVPLMIADGAILPVAVSPLSKRAIELVFWLDT